MTSSRDPYPVLKRLLFCIPLLFLFTGTVWAQEQLIQTDSTYDIGYFKVIVRGDSAFISSEQGYSLSIGSFKAGYAYHHALEILTPSEAFYLDTALKKRTDFPQHSWITCGSVWSEDYRIEKIRKAEYNLIVQQMNSRFVLTRNYYIPIGRAQISHLKHVSYLNDSLWLYIDGNDRITDTERQVPNPKWIKVKTRRFLQRSRYGIYEYDSWSGFNTDENKQQDAKPELCLNHSFTELLPVRQRKILFGPKTNFHILFYSKSRVGIFPFEQTATHSKIKFVTNNFGKVYDGDSWRWMDFETGLSFD